MSSDEKEELPEELLEAESAMFGGKPGIGYFLVSKIAVTTAASPLESVRITIEALRFLSEKMIDEAGITDEELKEADYIYRVAIAFINKIDSKDTFGLMFPDLEEDIEYTKKWFPFNEVPHLLFMGDAQFENAVEEIKMRAPKEDLEKYFNEVAPLIVMKYARIAIDKYSEKILENAFLNYANKFIMRLVYKMLTLLNDTKTLEKAFS
jgi:hypothetical protein